MEIFDFISYLALLSILQIHTVYSRSETPGKLRNVLLEKDGDQLERTCEK